MDLPQTIMIVEDEVITQRYLKNILGQYDIATVECYDNAKDALENIRQNSYEMILMDINIKGSMDGIQLAREILRTKNIPIVFITAHNDTETFQEVLELSPYGFIAKPFSSSDVEVAIQLAYKRYITYKENNVNKKVEVEKKTEIDISEEYIYSFVDNKLYHSGELIKLNTKQNKLLEVLSKNLNHVVSYDTLVDEIWGDNEISGSALRTLVYQIRKQLPDLPIISHSKLGYSLTKKS